MKLITGIGCMAVLAAGCLPGGPPPAGRQIVPDRQASLGAMVPPNGDGTLRVLFFRPNATDTGGSDLYVVSVDPSGVVSPERLLIQDVNTEDDLGCTWRIAPCSFDGRGRIMVYTNNDPPPQPGMFVGPKWVDPVTGEVSQDMGYFGYQSASGQRRFNLDPYVPNSPPPTAGTLTEADGSTTRIQLETAPQFSVDMSYQFIVEDFYYVDANNELIDVSPSGVAQQVAAGVTGFLYWLTPDGPLLLLSGPTADPMVQQLSLRDPVTQEVTALPFTGPGNASWSPDYRYMLFATGTYDPATMTEQTTNELYDRGAGTTQFLELPSVTYFSFQWRPGHDELWAASPPDISPPSISIITPGSSSPPVRVSGTRFEGFSPQGTYWVSTHDDPNKANPALLVGVADDPTGPVFPYNAPGTWVDSLAELPDGRLLSETYTNDIQREDVIAVDPRTGASQVLAERGMIAALGQTRFMGMFHYQGGRGDLTFVELDTGRSTTLAPEFTVTAFAEPQGKDLLAPGTRVIYQFQARTASPYDGLWLVNSP